MKIVSSSAALSVIVGFATLGIGGMSTQVHAQAQILPPPSVCAMLYEDCIKGGGSEAECEQLVRDCEEG